MKTFDEIMATKDKDALDTFAADHGVSLDKRRSFENMLADFEAAAPNISNPAREPIITKSMAPAAPAIPMLEVVITRNYRPRDNAVLIELGLPTEGVDAKIRKGTTVELPMEEAKDAIRAGVATFPPREI